MKLPTSSPDLSPRENVWGMMARHVYACNSKYSNLKKLKQAIMDVQEKIPQSVQSKLASSVTDHFSQVLKAKMQP